MTLPSWATIIVRPSKPTVPSRPARTRWSIPLASAAASGNRPDDQNHRSSAGGSAAISLCLQLGLVEVIVLPLAFIILHRDARFDLSLPAPTPSDRRQLAPRAIPMRRNPPSARQIPATWSSTP